MVTAWSLFYICMCITYICVSITDYDTCTLSVNNDNNKEIFNHIEFRIYFQRTPGNQGSSFRSVTKGQTNFHAHVFCSTDDSVWFAVNSWKSIRCVQNQVPMAYGYRTSYSVISLVPRSLPIIIFNGNVQYTRYSLPGGYISTACVT